MFVITLTRKQDYLISTDTMFKKQRGKKFFPNREKIDRAERGGESQLERHQTDAILE